MIPRNIKRLIGEADMTIPDFNTGVIRPADVSFRINVTTGLAEFGDHVQIGTCQEPGFPGAPWHVAHFSIPRARLIAYHINRVADILEGTIK